MAANTRLGGIGWLALIASLSFFIGTTNAWFPNHLVSQTQGKPCDPNVRDGDGQYPLCQQTTPTNPTNPNPNPNPTKHPNK
jgi:hypothetical protein